MSVGEKIRERRAELKWSQRDLSAKMGYAHHSTVARIESGAIDPPLSKVAKFAEVLGTTVAYLMEWEDEPEDQAEMEAGVLTDPELMGMIHEYLTLSEDKKKAVRQMVHAMASD